MAKKKPKHDTQKPPAPKRKSGKVDAKIPDQEKASKQKKTQDGKKQKKESKKKCCDGRIKFIEE